MTSTVLLLLEMATPSPPILLLDTVAPLEIVSEFPRTLAGKVQKYLLKRQLDA